MKKVLLLLTAVGGLAVLSSAANAQCGTLFGECLDDPTLDASFSGTTISNSAWVINTAGDATAAQFQDGFADSTGGNGVWYRAFLGDETEQVDADLTQDVLVPTAGKYQLSFDLVVEEFFTASSAIASLSNGDATVSLDILNDVPRTSEGGGFDGNPDHPVGVLYLDGVNAGDALTVSVAMVGGMSAGQNPQSLMVDNFSLSRVPEPATAALGLLGAVGIAGLLRRRR